MQCFVLTAMVPGIGLAMGAVQCKIETHGLGNQTASLSFPVCKMGTIIG